MLQPALEAVDVHVENVLRFVADWPPARPLCDPSFVRIAHLLLPLAAIAVLSCKASVKADINSSAEAEAPTEESEPFEAVAEAPLAPPARHTEFFGVARRLTLTPQPRPASCKCVAAVVGSAEDPSFDWHGDKPAVGPNALVVAVSDEGIECDHAGRGPSIAGIHRVGNDAVVELEEFKDTRPIALGAIIPNPGPDGSVYLKARGRTPYGRPLDQGHGPGRNLCKIASGTAGSTPIQSLP